MEEHGQGDRHGPRPRWPAASSKILSRRLHSLIHFHMQLRASLPTFGNSDHQRKTTISSVVSITFAIISSEFVVSFPLTVISSFRSAHLNPTIYNHSHMSFVLSCEPQGVQFFGGFGYDKAIWGQQNGDCPRRLKRCLDGFQKCGLVFLELGCGVPFLAAFSLF